MEEKEKKQVYLKTKKEFEKGSVIYTDIQKIKLEQELCNLMDNPYYKFDEGVRIHTYINGGFIHATAPIKTIMNLQIPHQCAKCENIKELQDWKIVREFFHDQKNFKYPLNINDILNLPYWKHECEYKYLHKDDIAAHMKRVNTWLNGVVSYINNHFRPPKRMLKFKGQKSIFEESYIFWNILKNLKFTKKEETW